MPGKIKVNLSNFLGGLQGRSTDDSPQGTYGFRDAHNVIVDRDGRLVPSPPIVDRPEVNILPTDKFLSFFWRGRHYYMVYDTLLKRRFLPPGNRSPNITGGRTYKQDEVTPLTNPFRSQSEITDVSEGPFVDTRLAQTYTQLDTLRGLSKAVFNTRYAPQYDFTVRPNGSGIVPNFDDAFPFSNIGGLRAVDRGTSYQDIYRNGEVTGTQTTAQAYTNLMNASSAFVADREFDTFLWNRWLIYDSDFKLLCMSVVRPTLVTEDSGEEPLGGSSSFMEKILQHRELNDPSFEVLRELAYRNTDVTYRAISHDDGVVFYSSSGNLPTMVWLGEEYTWDLRCLYSHDTCLPEVFGSYIKEEEYRRLGIPSEEEVRFEGEVLERTPRWGPYSFVGYNDVTAGGSVRRLLAVASGRDYSHFSLKDFQFEVFLLSGTFSSLIVPGSFYFSGFVETENSSGDGKTIVENSVWLGTDIDIFTQYDWTIYDSPFIVQGEHLFDLPGVRKTTEGFNFSSIRYNFYAIDPVGQVNVLTLAVGNIPNRPPRFQIYPSINALPIIRIRERDFSFKGTDYRGYGWDLIGGTFAIDRESTYDTTISTRAAVFPAVDIHLGGKVASNEDRTTEVSRILWRYDGGRFGFVCITDVVFYCAGADLGIAKTAAGRIGSATGDSAFSNNMKLTGNEPRSFFWVYNNGLTGTRLETRPLSDLPVTWIGPEGVGSTDAAVPVVQGFGYTVPAIGFRAQDHFRAATFEKGRFLLGGTSSLPHLFKGTGLTRLWDFQSFDNYWIRNTPTTDAQVATEANRSLELVLNTSGEDIIRWFGRKENNFVIGLNHGVLSLAALQRGMVAQAGQYTQGMPQTRVAPTNVFFNSYLLSRDHSTVYFWRTNRDYVAFRVHDVSAPISRNVTERGEDLFIVQLHADHSRGALVAETNSGIYYALVRHDHDHLSWTRLGSSFAHDGSFEDGLYIYVEGSNLKEIDFNSEETFPEDIEVPYVELHPPGYYIRTGEDSLVVQSENATYKNGEVIYTGGEVWVLDERGGKRRKLDRNGRFTSSDASTDSLRLGLVGRVSVESIIFTIS